MGKREIKVDTEDVDRVSIYRGKDFLGDIWLSEHYVQICLMKSEGAKLTGINIWQNTVDVRVRFDKV